MSNTPQLKDDAFFQLSPLMLLPGTKGRFSIYLKQEGEYVLYTREDEHFTQRHRRTLYESGVKEVFIRNEQRARYSRYVEENLAAMLHDVSLDQKERAAILYGASTEVIRDLFSDYLPKPLERKQYDRVADLVREALKYLREENALKTLATFISHDYQTYSHCVQVFVYTTCILSTYRAEEDLLLHAGIGAMLHDLGKTRIPRNVLNKPGKLNAEERQLVNTHPVQGVSLCINLPLSSETMHCILFHHERLDGSGYPGGIKGDDLPLFIRALSISDVYDALTSDRPYARGLRPYEALRIMRDEMSNALDMDVFKRFITVLSGAEIV